MKHKSDISRLELWAYCTAPLWLTALLGFLVALAGTLEGLTR